MRPIGVVLLTAALLVPLPVSAQTPTIDELRIAYQSLVNRERAASQAVVQLDDSVMANAAASALRAARADLVRSTSEIRIANNALLALDAAINLDLQRLYAGATALNTPDARELLVRTALLHWTVLLRRATMQSLHTEVEGLIDDPDCAGDIIGDMLLLAYFDTLFDVSAEAPGNAIAALSALARQTACLGTRQSALLASNLYDSYNAVIAFLRLNGVQGIEAFVAQAAVEPLLLVYDVEKYRGESSPLARWFRDHQNVLIVGVSSNRHPPVWHGLWLYDRRSGRLIGYSPTQQPRDENDVDLAAFYGSLGTRLNLGEYTCSFGEMIERGKTALGYICAGSVCQAKGPERGGGGTGLPAGARMAGSSQPAGGARPTSRGGFPNLGQAFGTTVCQHPGAASDTGTGRGSSICGQGGLNVGGAMKAASMVRCLSQQVVRPGTEAFRCLAEATGQCSNPVDRIAKEMQQTTFAGVKMGRECGVGKGKGDGSDGTEDELPPLPPSPLTVAKDDYAKAFVSEKTWKDALEYALRDLEAAREKEKNARGPEGWPAMKAREEAEKKVKEVDKKSVEAQKKAELANAKVKKEEAKQKKEEEKAKKEEAKAKKEAERKEKEQEAKAKKPGKKGLPACPPGTPDCGDNSCTAMEDQMGKTLTCVGRALAGNERDPHATRVGGCNPTVCDPVEPTGRGPATGKCLAALAGGPTITRTRQCWAVECAGGRMSTANNCCGATGTGGTLGAPAGDTGPASMCSATRCTEGSFPTPGQFGCECRESTGALGGVTPGVGPPTPRGSFTLVAPSEFLNTNSRPRGNTGLPPGPE